MCTGKNGDLGGEVNRLYVGRPQEKARIVRSTPVHVFKRPCLHVLSHARFPVRYCVYDRVLAHGHIFCDSMILVPPRHYCLYTLTRAWETCLSNVLAHQIQTWVAYPFET